MSEPTGDLEAYRPETLDALVGQEAAVKFLKHAADRWINEGRLPHMLFAGPMGTGKTTAAWAFAREVYGPAARECMQEYNASDDRGLAFVREVLAPLTEQKPVNGASVRLVLLDEADNLTADAEAALRRIMERGDSTTKFILTANYPQKLIPPILDRCYPVHFRPLDEKAIETLLRRVAEKEGHGNETEDRLMAAVKGARGSARRALLFYLNGATVDRETKVENAIDRLFRHWNGGAVESLIDVLRREGVDGLEFFPLFSAKLPAELLGGKQEDWLSVNDDLLATIGPAYFHATMVPDPLVVVRSWLHDRVQGRP